MKAEILKLLRAQDDVISGEALSSELGISRVSVWKHIHKLNQAGYGIESGSRGYRLGHSPDTPFPWEFPARESQIHYFDETSSTMEIAKELARKGCPDFTVVVADRQKKGRGRLKRVWISDAGGLYFTLVLRPRLPIALSARVSFLASLTLAHVLREWCEIDAKVKWPNDILVQERKISGMLTEMEAEADRINFINIGIGIIAKTIVVSIIPFLGIKRKAIGLESIHDISPDLSVPAPALVPIVVTPVITISIIPLCGFLGESVEYEAQS